MHIVKEKPILRLGGTAMSKLDKKAAATALRAAADRLSASPVSALVDDYDDDFDPLSDFDLDEDDEMSLMLDYEEAAEEYG